MREKQCNVVRRELEEVALNDEFSVTTAGHVRECAACREFQRQQLKLRQIIGSLGTVDAPADFDFRLRARLAAESDRTGFRNWSFAVRGLATAAVLVVFGVGAVMVWQRIQVEGPAIAVAPQTQTPQEQPRQPEFSQREASSHVDVRSGNALVAEHTTPRRNPGRASVYTPRRITSVDRSSQRANVLSLTQPAHDAAPVFPIEASL
ncbi:MAG TPA: hypothetical protein VFZ71_12340, partial [Pyrinomonadaceae bacterium]